MGAGEFRKYLGTSGTIDRYKWKTSKDKHSQLVRGFLCGGFPRGEPKKPLVAFDWEIRISDFAIEREIRKRISLSRNPSSVWISIKKPKSDFMDFHLYRSIGISEKGFAKLFFWTVVFFLLILLARARPLFLRTVFQILFRITQKTGKKGNPRTDISALQSVFGFRFRLQIRNADFSI